MGWYVMSTKIHCMRLIYLEYQPLAFGPTRKLPGWLRRRLKKIFPLLHPTLMLIYTPTLEEIPIVVAIVQAGPRHVGTGDLGYGSDKISGETEAGPGTGAETGTVTGTGTGTGTERQVRDTLNQGRRTLSPNFLFSLFILFFIFYFLFIFKFFC